MTLIQDDKLNKYINKIKFSRLLALDTCTGTTFYGKGFGQKILFTSCQKQRNLLNKSCLMECPVKKEFQKICSNKNWEVLTNNTTKNSILKYWKTFNKSIKIKVSFKCNLSKTHFVLHWYVFI